MIIFTFRPRLEHYDPHRTAAARCSEGGVHCPHRHGDDRPADRGAVLPAAVGMSYGAPLHADTRALTSPRVGMSCMHVLATHTRRGFSFLCE